MSAKVASYLVGSRDMFPQEILKIEHSKTLFPVFLYPGKAGVHSNSL